MTTEPNDSLERIVAELRALADDFGDSGNHPISDILDDKADRLEKLSAASVQMTDERKVVGHKTFHTAERGFYHEPLYADEAVELLAQCDRARETREALMPTEQAAINLMFDAHQRLHDFGWNDAIYCPKDRSEFLAIEAGSTGQHRCIYEGAWPDGRWWILSDGDMSPSRPVLWKALRLSPQSEDHGR